MPTAAPARHARHRFARSLARGGKRALRLRGAQRVARRAARLRGHGLTLLYHRVSSEGPAAHEVVRTVPLDLFAAHLEVICWFGEVVPARALASDRGARSAGRPRLALTFDDDYRSHLPVAELLARRGVPATFFLSGRAARGLGAYWWELLEQRIRERGLPAVAAELGYQAATPQELAARCEEAGAPDQLAGEDRPSPAHLDAGEIRYLASLPEIEIGFHTLRHPVLTALEPQEVGAAVADGRADLATLCGGPIDLFAYPHGKADRSTAAAVAAAGYRFAWTGRREPTTASTPPHLLGRWEPHGIDPGELGSLLAVRIHRAEPGPARR